MKVIKNGNGNKSDLDIEKYFCPFCLKYPEYTIKINNEGNICLSHCCNENKTIYIDFSRMEKFKSNINNKMCVNCNENASNICMKCGEFICDKCKKDHESIGDIGYLSNREYSLKSVFNVLKSQYCCKQHLKNVTYFCRLCKINLCDKCIIEHYHYKNESLYTEIKICPEGYNDNDQTLRNLANLAKTFYQCYQNGLKNSYMTLNIILNYHLIEGINRFIKANKNNKGKYNDSIIDNKFRKAEGEHFYIFNEFGNDDFNKYYFKLIVNFQQGNIRSFHKFLGIKERYMHLQRYKKEIFSFEQNYIIILTLSINKFLDELFLFSHLKEFREFPLILLDLKQKVNQFQNLQNQLELDLELIKKFVDSIDYRVDYELRRKIGNLLADKIMNEFGEKIDQKESILYLISLSIEDIEKKIITANNSIIDEKNKMTVLKQLKEKYQKALDLLQEVTANKFKNIQNLKKVKWPKENISYTFTSKSLNQKEIQEDIVLNLFFIIKRKLSETFNKFIHNKTVKLNYFAKEELKKFIFKNEIKNNEEKFQIAESQELSIGTNTSVEVNNKNQDRNEIKQENLVKGKEDIYYQKDGEEKNSQFIKNCKKRNIISIKRKIKIASKKFEKKWISINNILVENKAWDNISFLYEFYYNIKKKKIKYLILFLT